MISGSADTVRDIVKGTEPIRVKNLNGHNGSLISYAGDTYSIACGLRDCSGHMRPVLIVIQRKTIIVHKIVAWFKSSPIKVRKSAIRDSASSDVPICHARIDNRDNRPFPFCLVPGLTHIQLTEIPLPAIVAGRLA